MARIKGGLNAKKRHNRTLKLAKGYRGARSKQYRVANCLNLFAQKNPGKTPWTSSSLNTLLMRLLS